MRTSDQIPDQTEKTWRYRKMLLCTGKSKERAWLGSRIRHRRYVCRFLEMAEPESKRIQRLITDREIHDGKNCGSTIHLASNT